MCREWNISASVINGRRYMNKHTIGDLYQMQSLPLSAKIRMTEYRIRQWVDYYGENGVYVGFSGGKDSTVLLHMIRKIYPGGGKRGICGHWPGIPGNPRICAVF